jgi:RNA polymerase sigma-70 factor (ECF subfamily)
LSALIGHLDIIVSGVMVISQRIITNISSGLIMGAGITSSAISQVADTVTSSAKSKSISAARAALTPSATTTKVQNANLNLTVDRAVPRCSICPNSSDEALISFVCAGEKEALAYLFRRYARIVRGIAYRVLRDPSEADDLLQDIFLLIHRLCTTFDSSKGPARFWILQMTYRRAISRRRYLTSRHFYTRIDLDDAGAQFADPRAWTGQTEDSLDGRLGRGELQKIFEELSADQRQALLLRFVEGYTLPEIAEKMGQSRANIKNHYFRGLEKLRKSIFSGKLRGERAV